MNKLNFVVSWEKNKETAWSGTKYSIYKALSKYYVIYEHELKHNNVILKILKHLFFMSNSCYSSFLRKIDKIKYCKLHGNVFQFEEICGDTPERNTYIYIDLNVSYIKYMRDNIPSVFQVSGFQNIRKSSIDKRCVEQDFYLNKCAGIFTMGHWLRDYLISQGYNSEKVIHVGGGYNVNNNLYKPQIKTGTKILFVGKDFERKGGRITYEAFTILKKRMSNIELYVSGPEQDPIIDPIEGYHFEGQISFKEVAELYNKCDIFCMPSYFEAYGLVFIEALSFGLPCIGRNCYEMPYFIEDGKTGLLLKHDDSNELACLMERLLCDNTYKENVKSKREYYINEYSWDNVALRMKRLISGD